MNRRGFLQMVAGLVAAVGLGRPEEDPKPLTEGRLHVAEPTPVRYSDPFMNAGIYVKAHAVGGVVEGDFVEVAGVLSLSVTDARIIVRPATPDCLKNGRFLGQVHSRVGQQVWVRKSG